MNLPNSLTILRIILIPVFVIILLTKIPYGNYFAALIFTIAALTDSLDGYLARKRKEITKLGIILDPLADKLLITAALISLVELRMIPSWIVILILGREFAVSGLRMVKAEEGVVIPASILGKIKTISQIVAVILIILQKSYESYIHAPLGEWSLYVALAITILSGIEYFRKFSLQI